MTHELLQVNWAVLPYIMYKNVMVERLLGGYRCLGKIATTPYEVDLIIENSLKNERTETSKGV